MELKTCKYCHEVIDPRKNEPLGSLNGYVWHYRCVDSNMVINVPIKLKCIKEVVKFLTGKCDKVDERLLAEAVVSLKEYL